MERLTGERYAAEVRRRREEKLFLMGNTFKKKDQIKALGGIWDSGSRSWLMPNRESCLQAGGVPCDDGFKVPYPPKPPVQKRNQHV